MEIHQVGGHLPDCNIYLLLDEKNVLIDAGTGENMELVKEELSRLGVSVKDIDLVINTHGHYDHAGGDSYFSAEGCPIACHELEAEAIESGDPYLTVSYLFGKKTKGTKVSRKLKEGDLIELGESTLRVLHTPGHTVGSICLLEEKESLLFSGDLIFVDGIGRTDLPTGNLSQLLNSLKKIAKLNPRKIFPGHGPAFEGEVLCSYLW
jgi:glyoxylase-like metal-dependent hydrolase (beta-lactamase superfamily II)